MAESTGSWRDLLSERQLKLVKWSEQYAKDPFGDDGHNAKLTIAFMADMLDRAERAGVNTPSLFEPEKGDTDAN